MWRIGIFFILTCTVLEVSLSGTRIKDIAYVRGNYGQQLIGYGLVVGLHGTGDTQRSTFTLQSVTSMLKRFGITVPQTDLRLRNVAAVMVTSMVPGFAKEGASIDVVTSSLGDATSLHGGTLLMTPLSGIDGLVYGVAQGPISVGGHSVRAGGSEVRRNHTATGRVPGGALLERSVNTQIQSDSTVSLVLTQSDFTTATRVVEAINRKFEKPIALAQDGSTVIMTIPEEFKGPGKVVEFISMIEGEEITPDVGAKVVINERTGTIVVGGNVTLMAVAISHAGVNIDIQSVPIISQPGPFSQGQTVTTQLTTITTSADTTSVIALDRVASVQDVAKSLNALQVSARDMIAIFQALKEAGALKAELIIM
jgi:flagellar P-ring protein FlgI